MSYEDQPHTSSSGTVIAIVAVVLVLLLVAGLAILGLGGLYFFRLSNAPQRPHAVAPPVVFDERTVTVESKPEPAPVSEPQVHLTTEVAPPVVLVQKMTIQLDSQGKILADGHAVELDQLKDLLVKTREDGTIRLEVVVEVDRQCLFEHVARVQAVCKEAGVENVRVQALTATRD